MVATNDQWIVEADRDPRAAYRREGCGDERSGGGGGEGLSGESGGLRLAEVEVIIVATVTPDMSFPGDGLPGAGQAGDLRGRGGSIFRRLVPGFPYALQVGAKLVESGVHKKSDGDWCGCDELDHRLYGSGDLRDLRGWGGGGFAGALRGWGGGA